MRIINHLLLHYYIQTLKIIKSYIILMNIDDYPLNQEIEETKRAVAELKLSGDAGALQLAESDLNGMLQERKNWIKKQD